MKKPIDYAEHNPTPYPTPKVGELVNHDFETRDLTGWIIESGNAFSN